MTEPHDPDLLPPATERGSPLPDPSGWGTHVLTAAVAPDGAVWVGTYGEGIYVSRDGSGRRWERLTSDAENGISWDFVNAFAFAPGEVWYGTVGNGWGMSRDGGRTWRNWTFDDLGPRWQYVAPDGLAAVGDTVYVATADGLRITHDDGASWRELTEREALPNKYLLELEVEPREARPPVVRVRHLRGVSESLDGARTWRHARTMATERDARLAADPPGLPSDADHPLVRRILEWRRTFRDYPDPGGEIERPGEREHFWFRRPVSAEDNPYLDQTYLYGSTMGGNFQQHQGVEFNDPEGTAVRAIGDGTVRLAGEAEAGSKTVAILHDRSLEDGRRIWSTYYHNVDLTVSTGDRVAAGDLIAHVGNTGRATNDHLHLEIHVTPGEDLESVVDPEQRYPPYTVNPQLWIEPIPGTGAIAGRVLDATGTAVPGARVYGVTKALPRETPFSFAETYREKAHPDPIFGETFAIGDVPPGTYVLGVEVDGQRVYRTVEVAAGKVTEVTLRP
ncbi:MAG: peptidoglycan DD-metalloendopeptidase family protein [Gemmatimonadota bacterium]|nr:peptidoglycan DD-metalloendopeptidase family protein [Gemmatimonadota bacterium]